jgi:prepilin-type N-terminal cleavage/methylation domain-containing protein
MRVDPSRRRCAAERGFTFIELLVVIAILALLASIVVVNLDGMTAPTKLRGAARTIGNEILGWKQIAALRNRPISIEFDVANQRWRVIDAPSTTEVPNARDREEATYYGDWETPPSDVRLREVAFSSTDVERSGTTIITFEGDGEVYPSGFVAYLTHDRLNDDAGVSIEVSGITGLVSYHDGHTRSEEVRPPEDF